MQLLKRIAPRLRSPRSVHGITWGACAVLILVLFPSTLRRGWNEIRTDFPNYYTAALLARRNVPLEQYYDWPSFQREMQYAGWGRQAGGYVPHTPLTLLPMLPLTGLEPLAAKRVWLLMNAAFLALAIVLLARLARVRTATLLLLLLLGYGALRTNIELGQYYVFLFALLTLATWCLVRGQPFAGGFLMGAVCALKLYTLPLLVYFAWKRQWRASLGMVSACAVGGAVALAMFGWKANVFYAQYVVPRAMECSILDPYSPGIGTITQLLRRTFMMEPELNPHPLMDAPLVFFFLRPFILLSVFAVTVLALPKDSDHERRDLAWFLIATLLLSPYLASYVLILAAVPVALMLEGATFRRAVALFAAYLLLCRVPSPSWAGLFPRVWLLLALFVVVGYPYFRNLRFRRTAVVLSLVALAAFYDASRHQRSYEQEPARRFERVAVEAHAIYSSNPSTAASLISYESLSPVGYGLKTLREGRIQALAFDGLAFHPSMPASARPIFFELAAGRHSRIMSFDPATQGLEAVTSANLDAIKPAVSRDGRRIAFVSNGVLAIQDGSVLHRPATPRNVHDVAWFPGGERVALSAGPVGESRVFLLNLSGGTWKPLTSGLGDEGEPAVSPDGRRLALTLSRSGTRQVWIQDLATGAARQLTGGDCNSFAAAWQGDSKNVIFASDCGRGLGLPSLYRAGVLR